MMAMMNSILFSAVGQYACTLSNVVCAYVNVYLSCASTLCRANLCNGSNDLIVIVWIQYLHTIAHLHRVHSYLFPKANDSNRLQIVH